MEDSAGSRRSRPSSESGPAYAPEKKKRKLLLDKPKSERDLLRDRIVRLGDGQLRGIWDELVKYADEFESIAPELQVEAAEFLMECGSNLSFSAPVFARLVFLLRPKRQDLFDPIIQATCERFFSLIKDGKWIEARILLRFIASLALCDVLAPEAIERLIRLMLETITAPSLTTRGKDFVGYLCVSCLVWCGEKMDEGFLDHVIATVEGWVQDPTRTDSKEHQTAKDYCVFQGDEELDVVDPCGEACDIVKKCRNGLKWAVGYVLHVPDQRQSSQIGNVSALPPMSYEVLEEGDAGNSMTSCITENTHEYPMLEHRLRMVSKKADGDDEKIVESWIVMEIVSDIVHMFASSPQDMASRLGSIASRLGSIGPEVIVGCLFEHILRLPVSNHPMVLFESVFRTKSKEFESAIMHVMHIFFHNIDMLELSCVEKLAQWFGLHLTSNGFVAPWDEWMHGLWKNITYKKEKFLERSLEWSVRYSFHERVSFLIPPALRSFLPKNQEPDSMSFLRSPYSRRLLNAMMGMNPSTEEFERVVEEVSSEISAVQLPATVVVAVQPKEDGTGDDKSGESPSESRDRDDENGDDGNKDDSHAMEKLEENADVASENPQQDANEELKETNDGSGEQDQAGTEDEIVQTSVPVSFTPLPLPRTYDPIDVLVIQSVWYIGSRSYSHLWQALRHWGGFLKQYFQSEDVEISERAFLTVFDFWKNSRKWQSQSIRAIMQWGVADPRKHVLSFLLTNTKWCNVEDPFFWEVVESVLDVYSTKLARLKEDLLRIHSNDMEATADGDLISEERMIVVVPSIESLIDTTRMAVSMSVHDVILFLVAKAEAYNDLEEGQEWKMSLLLDRIRSFTQKRVPLLLPETKSELESAFEKISELEQSA
eukprot:TRINITY_DN41107_c0_g1_i1.p1 TRINITY_DN41107_c0_g1~~TRINITY_DN41107_c0_g1_i1.p1  ORF type:complete len:916 (+),score=266.64 TRINITY_DN41107_c0_g1_i1:105-2750(+)